MTLPAKSSFSTYGGIKQDYSSIVDPTTDRSADEVNPMVADVSCLTRTSIRAYVQFLANTGSTVINIQEAVWGNSLSIAPTISYTATGIFDIFFPTTVTDPLGVSQSVNLITAWANLGGNPGTLVVTQVNNHTFRINCYNLAGAANDLTGSTISLFAI